MNEDLARLREVLNKLPFWVVLPFIVSISVLSVLLYIAFLPLAYLYGLLLRPMVWIEWEKRGHDVLVIETESDHSRQWMARLSPLITNRAVHLNWKQRKTWDRWSLPVQLFELFGPHGKPEQFTELSLPAVIVFRQLRRPKTFTFGSRPKDLDVKFESLREELGLS